jgi:lysophospholipase L1-like esterase
MSRASSARRIAAAAVYGGGGLAGLGIAGFGVLLAEAKVARRAIGHPFGLVGPDATGLYGEGTGEPLELAMLGDSSAVGLGVRDVRQAPGALLASGLSALAGRPVRLTVAAVVGAETRDLDAQIDRLLHRSPLPHAAVIMIGANDITHRVKPADSVRALGLAVRRLRERGTQVVVGTCPDLGTVEPIPQPLRYVARRWSRQLAAAQIVAVVEAGGRTVSLGDLLGPEFVARPREMFSDDGFHPSAAGYAQAASALLPSLCAALELLPGELAAQRPDVRTGEGLDDVAHAAARAVAEPGTEVAGTEIAGNTRGPRGRWAVLLRRGRPPVPGDDAGSAAGNDAGNDEADAAADPALDPAGVALPAPLPGQAPDEVPRQLPVGSTVTGG